MNAETTFVLEHIEHLLRKTPLMLDVWLRDLPSECLHANEGPETFSAFDVVGHLIYGERTDWIIRARHILDRKPGPFEPFDRFGQQEEFAGRPIAELLDLFASLRPKNLEALHSMNLTDEDFALTGLHPALGEVTLRQLLATWVAHDQGHIAQIARVLAKRYRWEVGPWSEYMPVLMDRVLLGSTQK